MNIIRNYRNELEDKKFTEFTKLMELVSKNLEVESPFLVASPQVLYSIEVGDMIEKCADIFGYTHECAGKLFNEIMDKKELK
jgi:hypothetical protein